MDALGFDLAQVDEDSDTDATSWIADSGAEAGWGCTKASVGVGGVEIHYKRLAWDLATICGGW